MVSFEIAAGTVIGREHRRAGRNNQDSYHVTETTGSIGFAVCDGCGSAPHSEVGAQLGALMAARHIGYCSSAADVGFALGSCFLYPCPEYLGHPDFLLFTCLAGRITEQSCDFYACGDGVVIVNGQETWLGPFEGNSPPYPAYPLLRSRGFRVDEQATSEFVEIASLQPEELDSFLIGTDGVYDLAQVGPLSRFWEDDRFFTNPQALSRHLACLNKDRRDLDWEARRITQQPGLLADDTTLIVGRRIR